MGKIIASIYVTVDGVFENPGEWHFSVFNEEMNVYARDLLFSSSGVLLGRKTYDVFAASWPAIEDEEGFAARMNSISKWVASTTIKEARWQNSTVLDSDVVAAVSALRREPGGPILIYGSGQLVRSLIPHGLIDELRLWVHPSILGEGGRLFPDGGTPAGLKLLNVEPLTNGVVILTYAPVAPTEKGATTTQPEEAVAATKS
jgi:dihydrofolate reductase